MHKDGKKKFFRKKIFKKPSWTRGKQFWQFCRLLLTKKTLILCSILEKHEKNERKLCQNKVTSSKWSFGLVECSFVKLTGKVSEKLTNFRWMSKNDGRKTFLTEIFLTTNCSNGQRQSSFDDTAQKFLSKCQKTDRSSVNEEQKKEPIRRKSSSTDLLHKS